MDAELQIVSEAAKAVAIDTYKDAFSPGIKSFGEALSLIPRTINNLLNGWHVWVARGEKERERLIHGVQEEVIRTVLPQNLVELEPHVAVPALMAISYSMDAEKLRDMYIKLLAKAMDSTRRDEIHPALVEIIKQMSPYDVVFLQYLAGRGKTAPLIRYRLIINEDTRAGSTDEYYFSGLGETAAEAKKYSVSIDNLARLGLLTIDTMHHLINYDYSVLEKRDCVFSEWLLKTNAHMGYVNVKPEHGHAKITSLGTTFTSICLS